MNISEPFIRRPVMTVVITLAAVLFGVLAYFQLPVNDLPAVDYPVIQVQVGYPGASPETVASNIATPLERQFMQINGLELITSKSTQGSCSLTLQFALSKSVDAAATDVQAAISRATGNLPPDLPSPPTFSKTNPNDQPILYIGMVSDTMTRGQLYDLASTQVQQRITIISGVSQAQIFGTKTAIRIKAEPSALAARQMTMDDLAAAIRQGTTYQGAGQFDGPTRSLLLSPQGQLDNADAYNNLIIAHRNGAPVYLKDVATATDAVQDERIDMRFWVRGREVPKATVILAVSRQAGANAIEVASKVKALLPQVQSLLPASVSIVKIHDRSDTIVNSVNEVKHTLVIAFILVVLVIYIFLGRVTDTLIPVVALPLSLLLTFIVMNALGYSLDNLSLMAITLAVGFLVDDAIVFLENVVRRMEKYGETPLRASINGAAEISFTIVAMTVSLSAVFLPLVFMEGLVGRIFRELAVTIVVSILASGLVSLTLTPLMCSRLLAKRDEKEKKTFVERAFGAIEHRVLKFYGWSLWFFLKHKWVSAVTWVICLVGTVVLFYAVPKAFLPVGDSSFLWGFLIGPQGASPERMRDFQTVGEGILHQSDAVDMTFTATGVSGFLNSNQGMMLAFLKEPKERAPLHTMDPVTHQPKTIEHPTIQDIANHLQGQLFMGLSGNAFGVFTPQPVLQISTGASSRGTGQYSYTLSGIDPKEVYAAAERLIGKMSEQVGKIFLTVVPDLYVNTPSLQIDILRDQARSYKVSASSIESLLRSAYSQNYVYLIKKPEDQYQVILEVKDSARRLPEDLGRLYVRNDDGDKLVPLSAVARWKEVTGPLSVTHLNQFTSVSINFNVIPGVPISTATDLIDQLAANPQIVPTNIRGQFQGEALTFQETMASLKILIVLAIFVMYVILAVLYESYVHPLTVLSTLPTAMVGGLFMLYIFGEEASLYAFIGLFMLMGIVKKNGIMIVDFANHRVHGGADAVDAIHEASMDRFRPIVMTTLAAVMGAVPIALAIGNSGPERRPLGLVIVGGLIVSQFITLYVTPVIYLYMELFQERVLDRVPFLRAGHLELDGDDKNLPVAQPAS